MRSSLLLASVLFVLGGTPATASALPSVPPATVPGSDLLYEAESLIYSESAARGEVTRLLNRARGEFRRINDPALRAYWEARAVLALGIHLNQIGEGRRAATALTEGFELINKALGRGNFSEGLRVRADLYSQMMLSRGMLYMMRNGRAARDAAMEARRLDPKNVRALITVAGFYLNAPGVAGGDIQRGIEVLERALSLDPEDRNNRFLILVWLAEAHRSLDDQEPAREYLTRALQIYPESKTVQKLMQGG